MKTRLFALACLLTLGASAAAAQSNAGWLRYPSISPDGTTIVFTYKGDLYRVPSAGGAAVPLTTHTPTTSCPCGAATESRSHSRATATATSTSS